MKNYFYLSKLGNDDLIIVESPYKITEDTQTFGGTIVYIKDKGPDQEPLAEVGQHSNNWMAEEFELVPEKEAKLLISYHKSKKDLPIRNIILHASRDYDMSFEEVERILDRNKLPSKFYEELENHIKYRSFSED